MTRARQVHRPNSLHNELRPPIPQPPPGRREIPAPSYFTSRSHTPEIMARPVRRSALLSSRAMAEVSDQLVLVGVAGRLGCRAGAGQFQAAGQPVSELERIRQAELSGHLTHQARGIGNGHPGCGDM
jgi:hypothetical protein